MRSFITVIKTFNNLHKTFNLTSDIFFVNNDKVVSKITQDNAIFLERREAAAHKGYFREKF